MNSGNLLASPKIIQKASIEADQDIPMKETAEDKGKNSSVAEQSESKEDTTIENEKGGFHDNFNPSKTKHEKSIDKKCSQDLIDILRKNGVQIQADELSGVDLKSLFQSM